MTIYLIRHGKTVANEKHLYCGSTDLPLSEAGRVELMRRSCQVPAGVRFISSGMRRCNETLAILFGNVPYKVNPGFREIDFGVFEMHSYEQLKDDPRYQEWIAGDNNANIPPEGESGAQMTVRVMAAFQNIVDAGQNTVIITHGGVIAAILENLFTGENKNRYQWQPRPGQGYCLEIDGAQMSYRPYT